MNTDYRDCLSQLESRSLLPPDPRAVYVAGSLVRGWGNQRSDLDVYVITGTQWLSDTAQHETVALRPDIVLVESIYVDDRRWDIEYWLDLQIDELFGKISSSLTGNQPAGKHMTAPEVAILQRFGHAQSVTGDEWLSQRRRVLKGLPVNEVMTLRALHMLDIYTEDAVGQLAAGDVESAVLSTKLAFRHAVDALLANNGEFGESMKWFARRFRSANPKQMTFQAYWDIETMRSFDPNCPAAWVEEVLLECQRIAQEVGV